MLLLLGTFLVERRPSEWATWTLGVQWLDSRAWFWTRLNGGGWVRSGYGPGSWRVDPGGWSDDGDELGGVREPRRPTPSSGAASTTLPLRG